MEIGIIIAISIAVSFSVSVFVKIAIGVKWVININEILARKEREKSIEFRILKEWWANNQYNNNGEINSNNKEKYKRFIKLTKLYNKGKLQQ